MSQTARKKNRSKKSKRGLAKLTFHKLNWLEWVTVGLSLWFWISPKPYTLLFSVLLAIPVIGLLLNGINGRPSIASLVEISKGDDGEDEYDVADFIDLAALVILVRVLTDFEFESIYSLLIPGTIAFAIMLGILFATHRLISNSTKDRTWIYTSLLFNIFLYSYAGTYGANCVFDNAKPTVYQTEVVDKRISTGSKGRNTYYVKVKPWGHHYDYEEISVTGEQYSAIQTGQTISIDLMPGLFGIPWYYVE